jgi:hypothetical protein
MILGRVRPEVVHLVDGTSYRLGHWCDPSTWSLVPRRFATAASAGWVRRYSLSNKTFSLVDELPVQLCLCNVPARGQGEGHAERTGGAIRRVVQKNGDAHDSLVKASRTGPSNIYVRLHACSHPRPNCLVRSTSLTPVTSYRHMTGSAATGRKSNPTAVIVGMMHCRDSWCDELP